MVTTHLLHGLQEFGAHVVVAALSLDRFGQETGDVIPVGLEGTAGLGQRTLFGRHQFVEMILHGEADGRDVDSGPGKSRKPRRLGRIGIGQRQRVPAAAVESPRQMHHLGAQGGIAPVRLVVAALPIEGRLERVLHRQRPTLHEEQVRQGRVAEHPDERLHELAQVRRVDIRVGRLVGGYPAEQRHELGIVDDPRRVAAQR